MVACAGKLVKFAPLPLNEVVTQAMIDNGDAPSDSKLDDPIYQQIDQSKLVPLLTAALQEAIAKIETLEAKVTALEGS